MTQTSLIYAGGTFGCHGEPLSPLPADVFLPKLHQLLSTHGYHARPLNNDLIKDSSTLTPADFVHFYQLILQAMHEGARHLLLITGTDTLSYLAAFLSHALQGLPISVVVTGSMLPLFQPTSQTLSIDEKSDAWANLKLAIDFGQTNAHGVFVGFAGQIFFGDSVQKMHSSALDAFSGTMFDQAAQTIRSQRPVAPLLSPEILHHQSADNCQIHSLYCMPSHADYLAEQIRPLLNQPASALILIGYGAGNLPQSIHLADTLQALSDQGFLIIMASSAPFGARSDAYAAGAWQYNFGVLPSHAMTLPAIYARALWLCLSLAPSVRSQAWLDALEMDR